MTTVEMLRTSTPSAARVFAAFPILPFVNAASALVVSPLFWYVTGRPGRLDNPQAAAMSFAVITGVAALLVTLCGAVPAFSRLRKRGPISLTQTVAVGIALGNVPVIAIALAALYFTVLHIIGGTISYHLSPPLEIVAGFLPLIVIGSVLGTMSAWVFWMIAIRGTDVSRPS
ncbi:MAG TPA: hypothetical protein VNJ03_00635 [Vicinamibacterales bacterium]|nr:hypothetical protein [Vicinamibacterales bacterium]